MSKHSLEISCIKDESRFLELEKKWNSLLGLSDANNPFLTFEWQWSWWLSYSREATDSLCILTVTDQSIMELVGIAPFMIRKHLGVKVLCLIGTGRSDYLGIIAKESNALLAHELMEYIFSNRSSWDVCFLSNLKEGSLLLNAISEFMPQGVFVKSRIYEYAPYITIATDFDEYLKGKPKPFRKNVKRFTVQSQPNPLEYDLQSLDVNEDNAESIVEKFSMIERGSWKFVAGTAHMEKVEDKRFWGNLLPRFQRNGWLSAWILYYRGEAVAFIIGLRFGGRMHTHTSAYRETNKGAGNIVRNNLIKQAFDECLEVFDFLCGDEAYKLSWTKMKQPVIQTIVGKRTLRSRIYCLITIIRWSLSKNQALMQLKKAVERWC